MRVELDAKVETRDGQHVGSVERAIVDPSRNEVTDFIVTTRGLFGRDVIVPRHQLESADRDGETVRLGMSKEELERMPTYSEADYTLPASGWVPPATYGYPTAAFLWPAYTPAIRARQLTRRC